MLLLLSLLFSLALTAVFPARAGNPLDSEIVSRAAERSGYNTKVDADTIIGQVLGTVVSTIISFLGIFFILLILYGGYVWMNARGSESDVDRAKKIIRDAVIGLIILSSSYGVWLLVTEFIF